MPFAKDISGERFGKLVAVEMSLRNAKREAMWKCVCDCGNVVNVRLWNLLHGNTKSCGCANGRPHAS